MLGVGHAKAQHRDCPTGLAERSHARQVGELAVLHAESWHPKWRDEWPALADMERPRHAVLDSGAGEPLM